MSLRAAKDIQQNPASENQTTTVTTTTQINKKQENYFLTYLGRKELSSSLDLEHLSASRVIIGREDQVLHSHELSVAVGTLVI